MRRARGLTLPEVLIAVAISVVLLGAVYLLFLQGSKAYKQIGKLTPTYRRASLAIDVIAKEMKESFQRLYAPDPEDLFAEYGKSYLVGAFQDPAREKKEVIGYLFDVNQSRVLRVLYDPSFNPEDPSTQIPLPGADNPRILASGISFFYFRAEEDLLLSIRVLPEGSKEEISSKIDVDFSR